MQHRVQLTYSVSNPDKYVFEVNLRGLFYDSPNRGNRQRVSETGKESYYARNEPTEKYRSPVLDLFYNVNLANEQTITANVVGTVTDTKYGYSYKTYADKLFLNPIQEYSYDTDGKKYSLIGEVRYNKKFKPFIFSAGVSYLYGYTQNIYSSDEDVATEMKNGNTYTYAQIQGKLGKLDYIVGVGLSHQTYQQKNDNYKYWLFRPSLILSYTPFNGANIRLQSNISPVTPSLSMLSDVTEQYNSMEYIVGNPNLKPYWEVNNSLTLLYRQKRFYIQNRTGYTYSKNTIMGEIERKINENNDTYFEHSYKN